MNDLQSIFEMSFAVVAIAVMCWYAWRKWPPGADRRYLKLEFVTLVMTLGPGLVLGLFGKIAGAPAIAGALWTILLFPFWLYYTVRVIAIMVKGQTNR